MIRPMSKPFVAMGLLAAMAGAWYWALMPSAPSVPMKSAATSAVARGATTSVPVVRLDHLAAQDAARPVPDDGRNPFGGGPGLLASAGQSTSPVPTTVALPSSSPVVDAAAPTWPRLELIGVAEGREGGGLVRTAIISGPHGVQHARAGDVLEQVYRVERIGADGVDVRLVPEDRLLRLTLRP